MTLWKQKYMFEWRATIIDCAEWKWFSSYLIWETTSKISVSMWNLLPFIQLTELLSLSLNYHLFGCFKHEFHHSSSVPWPCVTTGSLYISTWRSFCICLCCMPISVSLWKIFQSILWLSFPLFSSYFKLVLQAYLKFEKNDACNLSLQTVLILRQVPLFVLFWNNPCFCFVRKLFPSMSK